MLASAVDLRVPAHYKEHISCSLVSNPSQIALSKHLSDELDEPTYVSDVELKMPSDP